jgi:hypothetical protein
MTVNVTLHRFELPTEPHHQALELLCAKALECGDLTAAYRLSDRRCRIRPLPEAHCFVLRAEAFHRMGDRAAAVNDLLRSHPKISPPIEECCCGESRCSRSPRRRH